MSFKVSVIIPIYNVSIYLPQCLDSVQSQFFEDFEVIGVDDCSTDDSVKVFEEYLNDKRFILRKHSENRGLPSARNTGLLSASGKYVYFLDSDDWIAPHTLSLLVNIAEKDKVDIVIGGVTKYDEDTGAALVPSNHSQVMKKSLSKTTIFETPELFFSVISWNKLIQKEFICKKCLHFKSMPRRFEDMLTYKWYLSGATVSNTEDITYFYRVRSKSSNNQSIMQANDLSVIRDKFLAYADIVYFCLKNNFFNTEYDPLNSKRAMMSLPRALSWIMPKILKINNYQNTPVDVHIESILAAKKLFALLDCSYIENLPENIPFFAKDIINNPVLDVLNKINNGEYS